MREISADHRLPFVYRLDPSFVHETVAHVEVFQDQSGTRVNVTASIARHLVAMDKVGQTTGNFMREGGPRLVVSADPTAAIEQRFERSLKFLLGACANAMGTRLVGLTQASEPPVHATAEHDALQAMVDARTPMVTRKTVGM